MSDNSFFLLQSQDEGFYHVSMKQTFNPTRENKPRSESTKTKSMLKVRHFEEFIMYLQEAKGSRSTRLVIEGTNDLSTGTCVGKLLECWGV